MTTAADETNNGGRKRRSITAQPWFPTFIGVWFAALFGLCSLALPVPLLERIVSALGIDGMFPAAAPPLGQTARMLLVLGFSGIGEIAGLLIGRRLATGVRKSADADQIAPPLSAADDLRSYDEELPSEEDEDDAIAPDADDEWNPEPAVQAATVAAEEPLPVVETVAEPRIVQATPRPAVATASLDSLGVVQLSERLALAITARRERSATGDETLPPASVSDCAESSATEPHPVEIDEVPAVAEAPWGDILLQRARRESPTIASVEPAEPDEFVSDHDDIEDETADAPYSSLLDIRPSHLRHAPVEIEEDEAEAIEPVVDIFRDAEPSVPSASTVAEADPAETERALKAALESLQRISGTR